MHVPGILIYLKNAPDKLALLLNVLPVTPWSRFNLISGILWADRDNRSSF